MDGDLEDDGISIGASDPILSDSGDGQDEDLYDIRTFFPYPQFRNEQESVIERIKEATEARKNILLVAQNGTGKTIIALTATIPVAIKDGRKKIIFLARTYTQNERVIQESKKIQYHLASKGLDINLGAISIRGRNEMCVHKTLKRLDLPPQESMSICSNLRKNKKCPYFNKLLRSGNKEALEGELKLLAQTPLSASDLMSYADQKGYCPYFLSKLLVKYVDIIVCNYQWVFNPFIRENFLDFLGVSLEDCIIIMDECHNLPEFANELNSFKLTPYSLRQAIKDLETYRALVKQINLVRALLSLIEGVKNKINGEMAVNPHKFLTQLLNAARIGSVNDLKNMIEDIREYGEAIEREKLDQGLYSRDFIGSMCDFLENFIEYIDDPAYFTCITVKIGENGRRSIALELKCSNPRLITDEIFSESFATLSLSGTLNPYIYSNLLGLNQIGKLVKIIHMKPPFPKENVKSILIKGLNTKGDNRNNTTYYNMLVALKPILMNTPKNVGVFCASYEVLEGLWNNGFERLAKLCNKEVFREEVGLKASDNDLIIKEFKACANDPEHNGAVLLGVCGGRNSEGEDFPGDEMNAVVIVGIPFQKPTPSVQAQIKYYDQIFPKKGKIFGYIAPAFQRSNQACGRPIRRVHDKGLIVLMDSRFYYYRDYLSDWIRRVLKVIPYDPRIIEREVKDFFA